MKKILFAVFTALLLALFAAAAPAEAAVSSWQQAGTIYPRWNTDFESETFKQSVRDLHSTGANFVTLVIPLYQSNLYSTDINPGNNTPTDQSLMAGISFAKSLGMKVALKPHAETYDGQWRAHINPGDRDGWFTAYGNWLEHYGRLAQGSGADLIVVGSELIDMATATSNPDNTARWNALIARVRGVFSGQLTYSANWGGSWWADEKNHIEFWPSLDYIGIAAYFSLDSGSANVDELKAKWEYWRTADIEPLHMRWGKPVLFTEIGYRSMNGARFQPFNSWDQWGANEWEQAQLYEALFSFWNNHAYMQGAHIWDWISDPGAGASWDQFYTPQHKQAQQVMTAWWSGTDTSPPPTASPSISGSASANPASVTVNQPVGISAQFTNGEGQASGVIVDIEVADAAGQKIFQQAFAGQSFGPGETRSYTVQWTPSSPGEYRVRIGVFNSDWTVNHFWNGSAATIGVVNQAPAPGANCDTVNTGSFFGCYFDNPDLTGFMAARTDNSINFDWADGSPDPSVGADTFSARWQGRFDFEAGTYRFTATADDGIRVYVDGENVIDRWVDQPATTYTADKVLAAGSHVIRVEYYENGGGATARLGWAKQGGTAPPPPPPANSAIEIWWPTDGATIGGVVPFKAILQNANVETYDMFWQVDGDRLNPMYTSQEDWPHKEAWVDVSGWSWKENGPYLLNFVAKDGSGATLAQKSSSVLIGR